MTHQRRNDMSNLGLTFGALSKPIFEQVEKQGYTLSEFNGNFVQKMADGLTLLRIQGILSNSEVVKAHKRLIKRVGELLS